MKLDKLKIRQLLIEIKSGDLKTIQMKYKEIYDFFSKLLFYVSYEILHNRLDAEEVVNDTFIAFFNSISDLNEEKNIKYWLITTAKNKSIDLLRKKNSRSLLIDIDLNEIKTNSGENTNDNSIFDEIKNYLSEDEYFIIIHRFVYQQSFRNIACELGIKTGTVTSRYSRAIKKLKTYFVKKEE